MTGPQGTGCVTLRVAVIEALVAMFQGTATNAQRALVAAEHEATLEVMERLVRSRRLRPVGRIRRRAGPTPAG
jgi:hypothetical protein